MNDNFFEEATEVLKTIFDALNQDNQIFKTIDTVKRKLFSKKRVNPLKLGEFAIRNSFGGLPP